MPEMKGHLLLSPHYHTEARAGCCLQLWTLEGAEGELRIANLEGASEQRGEGFEAGFAKGLGKAWLKGKDMGSGWSFHFATYALSVLAQLRHPPNSYVETVTNSRK